MLLQSCRTASLASSPHGEGRIGRLLELSLFGFGQIIGSLRINHFVNFCRSNVF